jgi:hypothetical protein
MKTVRPWAIAPEQLLSALLLQAFYCIRSERQLMEQLDYNLLCRGFVGAFELGSFWQKSELFGSLHSISPHPRTLPMPDAAW